jgi:hypothetical protein
LHVEECRHAGEQFMRSSVSAAGKPDLASSVVTTTMPAAFAKPIVSDSSVTSPTGAGAP